MDQRHPDREDRDKDRSRGGRDRDRLREGREGRDRTRDDREGRDKGSRNEDRYAKSTEKKNIVCQYYFATMQCKLGDDCHFIHSTDRELERELRRKHDEERDRRIDSKREQRELRDTRRYHPRSHRSDDRRSRPRLPMPKWQKDFTLKEFDPNRHDQLIRDAKKVCKEFRSKGTCARGDECDMFHPEERKVCQFYLHSNCKYRDNCKFLHDRRVKSELKKPMRKVCIPYIKGVCMEGAECKQFHPKIRDDPIDPKDFKCEHAPSNFVFNEQEVENLNFLLDMPFKFRSQRAEEQEEMLLIRHGISEFNYAQHNFFYQTGKAFRHITAKVFQTNPMFEDSPLHPYGRIQCENNSKPLKAINIHTVFVSPMDRCLESAYLLFKDHPRCSQMKFIVLPQCSEILSCAQDISNVRLMMQKYSKFFDFSLMMKMYSTNIYIWQILEIQNEELKLKLLDELEYFIHPETNEAIPINATQLLIENMDKIHPKPLESFEDTYKRSLDAKVLLQRYVMDNLINVLDQKIALVSHQCFLKQFSNPETDFEGRIKRGFQLETGEVISNSL